MFGEKLNFDIDGIVIKRPTTFKIERYPITNLTRVASGDMTGELIARKRKFFFTYESLTSAELDVILEALWRSSNIFHTLTYVDNNETKRVTVYPGAIPTVLHHTGSLWVWKNITFSLIER